MLFQEYYLINSVSYLGPLTVIVNVIAISFCTPLLCRGMCKFELVILF